MLKRIALTLCLVAGLGGTAFAQGSWICENAIGIYTDPNPTSRTARELAHFDGAPGEVTAYVVLTNPFNTNTNTPITIVGGFEFRLVLPENVQLLEVVLPSSRTINFANAPDFLCGADLPVVNGNVTLMTLTLLAPDGAEGLIYVTPVQEAPQSVPGAIVVTDFNDDFAISVAQPSSSDFASPVFGLYTGATIDLSPCISPFYVAPNGDDVAGDGSQSTPWGTIQHAIDEAVTGDTVELMSGRYRGDGNRDLDFTGKGIVLRGETGDPEDVILDCQGTGANRHYGAHFEFLEPTGSVLEGITIRNAFGPEDMPAAVFISGGWPFGALVNLRLTNCNIDSTSGTGILAGDYTPVAITMAGCRFAYNTMDGANLFFLGPGASITECLFESNGRNGLVLGDLWGGEVIDACEFYSNGAAGCDFVRDEPGMGVLTNSTLAFNQTGFRGSGTLEHCVVRDNTGSGIAFPIPMFGSKGVFYCDVYGNGGPGVVTGFGVLSKPSANRTALDKSGFALTIEFSKIHDNSGGGIWVEVEYLSCYRTLIYGNQGAGVYLQAPGYSTSGFSKIDGCTIVGNLRGIETSLSYGYGYDVPANLIANTLVAYNSGCGVEGVGSYTSGSPIWEFSNTDIFGNTGGNSCVDGLTVPGLGIISKDPLFCDIAGNDYGIAANSPCAPSVVQDLIGAMDVSCAGVSEPVVLAVDDVLADQGGQVRLTWYRSGYDEPSSEYSILGYDVYRRVSTSARTDRPEPGAKRLGWDYVVRVPARGDQGYQVVAPTLCNAEADGTPCPSVFLVSAVTSDPLVFFDSLPDSGSSIDNLVPGIPGSLAVTYAAAGNLVSWVAPDDPDVSRFDIWRTSGAAPDEFSGEPTAVVTETEWLDMEFTGSAWSQAYWVAAVDYAGNRGPLTQWNSAGVSAVDDNAVPSTFALHGNVPNPFNPSTTLRFDLPRSARVELAIYDVAGRRVRRLVAGETFPPGRHEAIWDGRDDAGLSMGSGVYLYRLDAGEYRETKRMTLVR